MKLWVFVSCCLIFGGVLRWFALKGGRQVKKENPTTMKISSDGFFTELWSFNRQNIQVFPHLTTKQGFSGKGFAITLTVDKKDGSLWNPDG